MGSIVAVAGAQGAVELVELYGLNGEREVTMHGWFGQPTVFSMLRDRPPCLIAVEASALPPDMVASLRDKGHSVVVMPSVRAKSLMRRRRSAKDVCRLVLGLTAWPKPYTQTLH